MSRLRFEKRFTDDLAEAIEWYQRASPEVCGTLRISISERLQSVEEFPESFQLLLNGRGHRGATLRSFPWMIVFRLENQTIRLLRLIHLASNWNLG